MSYVTYPNDSPYAITPQLDWRLGRYVHRSIKPASTDQLFTITPTYHLRPDKLSHDLYGTPNYYWVFMARNLDQIRDIIYDQTVGKTIYLPTLATIQAALGPNAT